MTDHQNFDNGGQFFNIFLDAAGDLHFKANGHDGQGDTRMSVADQSGTLTVGGNGKFGRIQLRDDTGGATISLGGNGTQTAALIGGSTGQSGRVRLTDGAGVITADLDGHLGTLVLGNAGTDGDLLVLDSAGTATFRVDGDPRSVAVTNAAGQNTAVVTGEQGWIQLFDANGTVTVDLHGDAGSLVLGTTTGTDGDLILQDGAGGVSITADGGNGLITCRELTVSATALLATDATPLQGALDRVLALRGVHAAGRAVVLADGDEDLTVTDSRGVTSVSYTRLIAFLTEAIKEQEATLRAALARIEVLEASRESVA